MCYAINKLACIFGSFSKMISRIFNRKVFFIVVSRCFKINRLIIYEFNLKNQDNQLNSQINLTYRFATKEDILKFDAVHGYTNKDKKYSIERMECGDECVLALNNENIIGYMWAMHGSMELAMNNIIKLPKDKVYIYKGFVWPEYRGRRVLNGMDSYLFDKIRAEGIVKSIVTTINVSNKSSIKARENAGWKIVGGILQIIIISKKICYISKTDLSYLMDSNDD